jgi:choline dehydrogenase
MRFSTLTLLSAALQSARAVSPPVRANIIHNNAELRSSYDFIIVGGGASGLTVADRLTEDPNTTVLVLEYGPFDLHEPAVLVPGLLNLTSTPYWFNLSSTPQENLGNRSFQVTIAAAVGGGTVINGMLFHRGARADYEAWEELGAKGWSWNDLLPYFKKSETFTPPASDFAQEWDIEYDGKTHGKSGPIQASYPPYQFPVIKYFFKAFHKLGIATPADPSDGSGKGVYWAPSTLDPVNKTRSYARIAHYDRVVASRPNYHVLPMSPATKILMDKNKKATGVQYTSRENGKVSQANAKKEVILAAGAVHTPQLLMLSGIGDKSVLGELGIESVSDVPGVGHNFQDHPTMFFINSCE